MANFKLIKQILDESGNEQLINGGIVIDETSGVSFAGHVADATIHTPKATIDAERTAAINVLKDGTTDLSGNLSADYNTLKKIETQVTGVKESLNTFLQGAADGGDLDRLIELVTAIGDNADSIDALTSSKVNVADIVNTLTSTEATKPLAAAQGKALKDLIDALEASVQAAITNTHTHANKAVLDAVNENASGDLTYNGKALNGETGIAFIGATSDTPSYVGKLRMVVAAYTPASAE